jgi:hypothetical protein
MPAQQAVMLQGGTLHPLEMVLLRIIACDETIQ